MSITQLLLLICARALQRPPRAMAQYAPCGLLPAPGVHIGVATDTPNGLVVVVIRDADKLALANLVRRRSELNQRARVGKSVPQDFDGGASTLSNLGGFRVDSFDAVLNSPQATILAVGRIIERPFVEDGLLRGASTMKLNLAVDHRILDVAARVRLLDDVVGIVESPATAIMR